MNIAYSCLLSHYCSRPWPAFISCVIAPQGNSANQLCCEKHTQYVWTAKQYINTENEKHDDDDYDTEDDGNDDNDAPSTKF
jgi:hypothetical protein